MSYFPRTLIKAAPPTDSNSFVKNTNGIFTVNNQRFRFIGTNKYQLGINGMTSSEIDTYMAACQKLGISVIRTWAFADQGFLKLYYPLGTNLISNSSFETDTTGWTLGGDFTRVNTDAQTGSWSVKQVSNGGFSQLSTTVTVTASTNYILTFWHKTTNSGGFPDICFIGTSAGDNSIKDAGFIGDTGGLWQKFQVVFNSGSHTSVVVTLGNFGGNVTAFFDNVNVSIPGSPPALEVDELMMRAMDLAIDKAGKYGIRLLPSLMDGNFFNYNSKQWYINNANAINGTSLDAGQHSTDFFTQTGPRNIYKLWVDTLTGRTNFYNGIINKNNPAIFSWELGNELRAEAFEGSDVNTLSSSNLTLLSKPSGWIDIMSTYFKTKDTNHMVAFGDAAHGWAYATGDTVWNGTYYGIDYGIISALPNIDYVDYHLYPTKGDNIHLIEFGQYLGFPNSVSGDGFRVQLRHFVNTVKANGKPAVIGEVGFTREQVGDNTYFPLYPRVNAFTEIGNVWFAAGGDGIVPWQGEAGDGGSYTVALSGWNGDLTNLNFNDLPTQAMITKANTEVLPAKL